MREEYIRNYAQSIMLPVSLNLFWHHASWPIEPQDAITMVRTEFYELTGQTAPFCLSTNNAPYIPAFSRAAERALFHAANVWRQLTEDLRRVERVVAANPSIAHDSLFSTGDFGSQFEIEAFLASVSAITEKGLIEKEFDSKAENFRFQPRLFKSRALGEALIEKLHEAAKSFLKLGFESKWRDVRNSAYHMKPSLNDWKMEASVSRKGGKYFVVLDGIHVVKGAPSDLIILFSEAFGEFVKYVTNVRDLLTDFAFKNISFPRHNTYSGIFDPLGNMNVCLGPNGYDLRHYPQTAVDFVGPVKSD